MTDDGDNEAIWINAKAMLDSPGSMLAHGLAMSLLMKVWSRDKSAFCFEPECLSARLEARAKDRAKTAQLLRDHEAELREFFVVLPDGRWAPSPKYFALNDPYAENAPM